MEDDANDAVEKDIQAREKGKIIKDEQDEIVKVQFASFQRYFKYAGGFWLLIPYLILLSIFIFIGMAINYYI